MTTGFEITHGGSPAARIELLATPAGRKPRTRRQFVLASHTILVVDDHPVVRELFASALRELAYEVVEAEGPLQAQRLALARGKIDLLLTDFRMPDMNGVQLAQWFHTRFPLCKVVLASTAPWEAEPYLTFPHNLVLMQKQDAYSRLAKIVHDLLDKPAGGSAQEDLDRRWRGAAHPGPEQIGHRAKPGPTRMGTGAKSGS